MNSRLNAIQNDLYRRFGKNDFEINEYLKVNMIPQIKFMNTKRLVDYYRDNNYLLYIFYQIKYQHYKVKFGIDIPACVKIGQGFVIEHIGGITVNPQVVIGDNCSIYNGVTIGIEKRGKREGVPIIRNKVWIGANSVIVGKITIGENVLIAPGTFVNCDVPDNSIVLGNPSHIISNSQATKGYIENIIY